MYKHIDNSNQNDISELKKKIYDLEKTESSDDLKTSQNELKIKILENEVKNLKSQIKKLKNITKKLYERIKSNPHVKLCEQEKVKDIPDIQQSEKEQEFKVKKKITLEKHINIKHPEAKNPNKMGLREGQFGLDVRQVKEKETETPKNQLKKGTV